MNDSAYHGAVGWLLNAIDAAHPGFLASEADKAEGTPYAEVLREWADRNTPVVTDEAAS